MRITQPVEVYAFVFRFSHPLRMSSSVIVFGIALVILTTLLVGFLFFYFLFFKVFLIFYEKMLLTFALIFFPFNFHLYPNSIISRNWETEALNMIKAMKSMYFH